MPNSALSRAATRAWCMPSTVKAATESGRGIRGGRTQDMHAVDGAQAVVQPGRQRRLVPFDLLPADAPELVHGRTEGHGADHVGRLPPSSRSGGSVQMTSSRSTRSTAPPPARKGSPVANTCRGPISAPAP